MTINVLEYLENTVKKCPGKTAFSDGSMSLTFRQVSDAAKSIGTFLSLNGYNREPVIICMRKSPETVAAFFGVVYSGCFYVPFDDDMPRHRVEMILERVRPRAVICDGYMQDYLSGLAYSCPLYSYADVCGTPVDEERLGRVRAKAIDTDPIYTVFTSGSTGAPKGVIACHRSVIDYIEGLSGALGFDEDTVFGNQAPLYVDACLKELYPTLKFGATTYLIPKSLFMFPLKLVEYLIKHEINTICWVASALTMISSYDTLQRAVPGCLRLIAFAGEVFPAPHLSKWRAALPGARFVNLYGPTETTGVACYYEVDREFPPDQTLPIGKPFRNTEVLLISDDGRQAVNGASGEIYIRGTALTLGYWSDFDKTNEAFVQNPLNSFYPELVYRTGDIGRYNEYGELTFLSRKDHQIKHMGHRIELGEIEAVASKLDGANSVCCVFDDERKKISLFYTGDPGPAAFAAYLKENLPRYMVPQSIINIDEMPLTPNGKIDRKALKTRALGGNNQVPPD